MNESSKRTIVLLRDRTDGFSDIEHFLRSRDFHIKIVNQARDAVKLITEEVPMFALLSASLMPQKSNWLLRLLNQITTVILFVNRVSAKNLAVTRNLNGSYLFLPPLNPRGLDQILNQINREQIKRKELVSQFKKDHLWIMSTLADLAVNAICKPTVNKETAERVQFTRKMNCFYIQTKKLSGYFVIAYGQDRSLDSAWLDELRSHMHQYLENFDDDFRMTSASELEVKEVNYPEWAQQKSDFILQSLHQDAEIAIAFFKDPQELSAKPSNKRGYLEIDLEQFPEDLVADFDVYVYLPQNARFVLYNCKGEKLDLSKKKHLASKGLNTLHVSKRSLDQILHHRVQKGIQESSQAFLV